MDTEALARHVGEGAAVAGFGGGEPVDDADLPETDCNVFAPGALGGMIHHGNADRLRCRMLLDAASSPTPTADEIPPTGACWSSPTWWPTSCFERVQELQHFRWDEREVTDRLGPIMRKAYRDSRLAPASRPCRCAWGAYELGIERFVGTVTTRGYIS